MTITEKLIHIFKEFLNLIFPQKCLSCGIQNTLLCEKCLDTFPPSAIYEIGTRKILAATSYEDEIVKKTIRMFKYRGIKSLAEPLGALIMQRLGNKITHLISDSSQTAVIIPIPLSGKKLKKRGYNQAEILGKYLSDKLSIIMRGDVLYKIRETISQVEIKDRDKRLKNLKGVFAVKNPEIIKDKIIILVDDVTTTGATLNEASSVLKQAGAGKIIGLTVAKG